MEEGTQTAGEEVLNGKLKFKRKAGLKGNSLAAKKRNLEYVVVGPHT